MWFTVLFLHRSTRTLFIIFCDVFLEHRILKAAVAHESFDWSEDSRGDLVFKEPRHVLTGERRGADPSAVLLV